MSKRLLSPGLQPPPKRLRTEVPHNVTSFAPSFDVLYDEIVLVIFSHLSYKDLCRVQPTSQNWSRLALDNQLWKKLYLEEYGRTRLRGVRGFFGRQDGREYKPLPSRAKLEDTEDIRDWKWMFRISSNWRTGRCVVEQWNYHDPFGSRRSQSGPVSTSNPCRINIILVGSLLVTSLEGHPHPTLSLVTPDHVRYTLQCRTRRSTSNTTITALALDQSPPTSAHRARLAAFLSTGEFIVFSVDHLRPSHSSRTSSYLPAVTVPRVAPIIQAVFHDALLVTLSESFHLSLYDLSTDAIVHMQTLTSFTSYPPTSMVLTPLTPASYKLILAYAIPVFPAHWSVGATELMITSELSKMVVSSTRTIRAIDVPTGWVDAQKLRIMREQWSRKVARVADTQTDGKWVVLAPADASPASPEVNEDNAKASPTSYTASSLHSPSSLQLYRLSFPSSSSASAVPKLTFIRTLHGQMGPCSAVALADGRCVSLGVNGSIWVWDLEGGTGTEVQPGRRADFSEEPLPTVAVVKGTVVFDERRIISADANEVEVRRFDV